MNKNYFKSMYTLAAIAIIAVGCGGNINGKNYIITASESGLEGEMCQAATGNMMTTQNGSSVTGTLVISCNGFSSQGTFNGTWSNNTITNVSMTLTLPAQYGGSTCQYSNGTLILNNNNEQITGTLIAAQPVTTGSPVPGQNAPYGACSTITLTGNSSN